MSTNATRTVTGIVAQDKAAGSREILVHPQDTLPFATGELKPKAQTVSVQTNDTHQGGATGQVTETNVVRAIFKGSTDSDMPPDIVKGEIVELTQDSNTGTLYWSASGRTTHERSRERKEMRAANKEGYSKSLDDGNSYFIRINTLTTKEIRLQTTKSDGEEFAYTIVINPSESKIQICDNENNEITIESKDEHVFMRNKSESIVDICKENIVIACKDSIILKAEKQIVMDTPLWTNNNEHGDGCMQMKCKGLKIDATDNVNINSPSGIGLHGPTEARTIVSGGIQAEYYSTGKY